MTEIPEHLLHRAAERRAAMRVRRSEDTPPGPVVAGRFRPSTPTMPEVGSRWVYRGGPVATLVEFDPTAGTVALRFDDGGRGGELDGVFPGEDWTPAPDPEVQRKFERIAEVTRRSPGKTTLLAPVDLAVIGRAHMAVLLLAAQGLTGSLAAAELEAAIEAGKRAMGEPAGLTPPGADGPYAQEADGTWVPAKPLPFFGPPTIRQVLADLLHLRRPSWRPADRDPNPTESRLRRG